MLRCICVWIFLLLADTGSSQVRVTVTDYQKVQEPALEVDLAYPERVVNRAIQEKLEKMGYKARDTKGFTLFKGVRLPSLGDDSYDLYFRADRKNKNDKDNTVLTLMMTKGNQVFISDATDTLLMRRAKKYLETIYLIMDAYDLEEQIAEQTDALKRADKKLSSLADEETELAKKKKKLQDEIEDNIKAQESQKAEIDKQKGILDTLTAKRKK